MLSDIGGWWLGFPIIFSIASCVQCIHCTIVHTNCTIVCHTACIPSVSAIEVFVTCPTKFNDSVCIDFQATLVKFDTL